MEIWRDIEDYIGLYQVSDDGRVRSLLRLLPYAVDAGVRKPSRVLKYGKSTQGRLQVALSRDGVTKRFLVHRLVLAAFAGPCPEGMEGLHKSLNRTDCRISNLKWGTHTEAMQSKAIFGTSPVGEKAGKSSLVDQDVLAARYGVSQVSIQAIKARRTWKHV
jgi:hypothetical protein